MEHTKVVTEKNKMEWKKDDGGVDDNVFDDANTGWNYFLYLNISTLLFRHLIHISHTT